MELGKVTNIFWNPTFSPTGGAYILSFIYNDFKSRQIRYTLQIQNSSISGKIRTMAFYSNIILYVNNKPRPAHFLTYTNCKVLCVFNYCIIGSIFIFLGMWPLHIMFSLLFTPLMFTHIISPTAINLIDLRTRLNPHL